MHDKCQPRHGSLSHGRPPFMDGSESRTSGGKEIQWSVSPLADPSCCGEMLQASLIRNSFTLRSRPYDGLSG
jgi:hypothetical protein